MPMIYRSNCKICIRCKESPGYMKELYATRAYVARGESVRQFSKRTESNELSVGRHVKKHMFLNDTDLNDNQLKEQAAKSITEVLQALTASGTARQAVLDILYEKIRAKGDISIGRGKDDDISMKDAMSLLLTASKNTDEVKAKEKDQESDLLKQLRGLRSGGTGIASTSPAVGWNKEIPTEEGEVVDPVEDVT